MLQFLHRILYLTRGSHRSLVLIACLLILISSLEVIGTGMIGPFIAVATNPKVVETNGVLKLVHQHLQFIPEQYFLLVLGALVMLAFYIKSYLGFEAQKAVFGFGHGLRGSIAYKLAKAYLEAPYSYHLKINSATVIQNVITTTDAVCIDVLIPFLTAISNGFIILALTLLLVRTSVLAMLQIVLLLPILIGLVKLLKNRLAFWSHEGWLASKEILKILNHSLGGLKESRVIGCEGYFLQQMDQQTHRLAKNYSLSNSYGNLPRFVIEAFMITFLVSFTLLYIQLHQGQNLTAVLGIFALASIRLLPAVSNLVGNINHFKANAFTVDKLYFSFQEIDKLDQLHRPEARPSPLGQITGKVDSGKLDSSPLTFNHQIELEGVTFTYPDAERRSLDEVSLVIPKGKSIGLIGKSGSGKTTLADVILGLFTPQAGDIRVDGVSVYGNLSAWQQLLGYVPQTIFLIDDTLERNIAFGVPDSQIDPQRLQQAIEMAQLSEVVAQLPAGVKTIVGERGVLLSGGQRQRVGIARVLYHQREVLVFDEATAALDNETEQLITEATEALSGTKTIIIIAHRLSTIEHCDHIYQLSQGKIIRSGSYQDVVANKC